MQVTHRARRIIFFSIGIITVLLIGYWLSPVLNPFLIALGIAYILNPIVSFLEKKGIPRFVTTLGFFIVFTALIVLFLLFSVPALVHQVGQAPAALFGGERSTWRDDNGNGAPDYDADPAKSEFEDWNKNGVMDYGYVDRLILRLEKITGKSKSQMGAFVRDELKSAETKKTLQDVFSKALSGVQENAIGFLGSLFNLITILILVPVYAFFLMLEIDRIIAAVKAYLPGAYRDRILYVAGQINASVSGFFRGRLIICIIVGVITWVGLLICGVRFSGIIAILTGASIIVPLLWIPLGLAPAMLLAYFDFGFTWPFFIVPVIYLLIQAVDFALQPLIIGKYAGLHPLTLILSIFLFGAMLGVYGILLAVPLACVAKILGKEFLLPVLKRYAEEKPPDSAPRPETTNAAEPAPDGDASTRGLK